MNNERYDDVPLDRLHLDPNNPRLPRDEDWSKVPEAQLLKIFLQRYNLMELGNSMADKGFTPRHAEALLVVPKPEAQDEYVVIEGNRRLATLKLLTSPAHRREVGAAGKWKELAAQASSRQLDPAPVIIYDKREELDDYLGFRHITGPTPWRPEAKARFIAKLLKAGESIGNIARRIGSNHRTVRRFAEAHAVYSQAFEQGIAMGQVESFFGVFYNALDRPGIREFVGLDSKRTFEALPTAPISADHFEDLRDLIGLLYGDDEQKLDKVINESRQLKKLGEVLQDERGRINLLSERDLDAAYRLIGGGRTELLGLLNTARQRLAEANGQAAEFCGDDGIREEVQRICRLVDDMKLRYKLDGS